MRVLVFTSQINLLGGAERLSVELAVALNRIEGIRADLLCMVSEGFADVADIRKKYLDAGIPSISFLGRDPGMGIGGTLTTARRLRNLLIQEKYDIVETSLRGPRVMAQMAVIGTKTFHVIGLHDFYEYYSERRGYKFFILYLKFTTRTHYYAISHGVEKDWIAHTKTANSRIRVIYNSIHPSFFHSHAERDSVVNEFGLDGAKPILLFIGRLTLVKGIDVLISATRELFTRKEASLLIVGLPEIQLDPQFGETCGFLERLKNLSDGNLSVKWLGRREDVPRLMASADLLIHPARREGFGLVLAEAMAVGVPIVASNVGGIPEVLQNSGAVLVESGNVAAFTAAIYHVLNRSPEERKSAQQKAFKRASYFLTERRAGEMADYFRYILNTRNEN